MNASDYLTTTQMEISGTWGTEVEVIALATLSKTTIAIYYYPPGAKVPLWHHYSPLCSDADTSICTILETILTVSRLSQVVCNFHFMQSVCTNLFFFVCSALYILYSFSTALIILYLFSINCFLINYMFVICGKSRVHLTW